MSRAEQDEQFSEFVGATWHWLYRTAYLLVGDHGRAEDLVQTALASTYARWGRIRDTDTAGGYARTALVNAARSQFRRPSWTRETSVADLPDFASETDPSTRPSVIAALGALPPRQRAVVVLRFYEDLSIADTADLLNVSTGTVKSQTNDGLSKLRDLLGEDAFEKEQTHD